MAEPLRDEYGNSYPSQTTTQLVDEGYGLYDPAYNLHDLRNRPVSRGGLAPDPNTPARDPLDVLLDAVRLSPSSDNVLRLQRLLALQTLPARAAGIGEGILQQSRLAAGSPQEVFAQFGNQISQIQQQLRQTSETLARRGGYNYGLQRQAPQAANLGQAAASLQDLFTQAALSGRQGSLQLATGVRPILAAQVPPARESVQTGAFPYELAGQSAVNLAEQLQRLFPRRQPTDLATPTPIVPYTPPTTQYPQYLDPYGS